MALSTDTASHNQRANSDRFSDADRINVQLRDGAGARPVAGQTAAAAGEAVHGGQVLAQVQGPEVPAYADVRTGLDAESAPPPLVDGETDLTAISPAAGGARGASGGPPSNDEGSSFRASVDPPPAATLHDESVGRLSFSLDTVTDAATTAASFAASQITDTPGGPVVSVVFPAVGATEGFSLPAAVPAASGPAILISISVAPLAIYESPADSPGATAQFRATGHFSDGSTADVTALAVWRNFDPALSGFFPVAPDGGVALFVPSPDFESRAVYRAVVEATLGAVGARADITVIDVNERPRAADDQFSELNSIGDVQIGTTHAIGSLLANDTDPDTQNTASVSNRLAFVGAGLPAGGLAPVLNGTITVDGTYGRLMIDAASGAATYQVGVTAAQAASLVAAAGGPLGLFGNDLFAYRIQDGLGAQGSRDGTIAVPFAVTANGAPVAADDAFAATGNTQTFSAADLLANDTDDGGGAHLAVTSVALARPADGNLTDNGDGTWTFRAAVGYLGNVVVDYTVRDFDGLGRSASGQAVISVTNNPNAAPLAQDDRIGARPGSATVTGGNLFDDNGNGADRDPNAGDAISVTGAVGGVDAGSGAGYFVLDGLYGQVRINAATGDFDYTIGVTAAQATAYAGLSAGAPATERFTYTIRDIPGLTDSADLIIDVAAPDAVPVPLDVTIALDPTSDTGQAGDHLINDATPTFVGTLVGAGSILVQIINGANQVVQVGAGQIQGANWSFTAAPLIEGQYSVRVTASDGTSDVTRALLPVVVVDLAGPVAVDDGSLGQVLTTAPFDIDVSRLLANDVGVARFVGLSVDAAQGTVTDAGGGHWTFRAANGFTGAATLTYSVADAAGNISTAQATVDVVAGVGLTGLPDYDGSGGLTGYLFVGTDNPVAGSRAGYSVALTQDVNGDGIGDIVIGDPEAVFGGQSLGATYVVYGGAINLATLDMADGTLDRRIELGRVRSSGAGYEFIGFGEGDQQGFSVAALGDVDGDGRGDLAFSAPAPIPDSSGNPQIGLVDLVFGDPDIFGQHSELSHAFGNLRFSTLSGYAPGARAGHSVAAAGDFNGDGLADLLVGEPGLNFGAGGSTGGAYLIYGSSAPASLTSAAAGIGGFLLTGPNFALAGTEVSGAGDIDGDGFDDIVIGTPNGVLYLVYGGQAIGAGQSLAAVGGSLRGTVIGGLARTGDVDNLDIAPVGDFNGDGYDDLLISNGADRAAAYLLFGGAALGANVDVDNLIANGAGLRFAALSGTEVDLAVSSIGDLNGDGLADLALSDAGTGATYVLFGSRTLQGTVDATRIGFDFAGFHLTTSRSNFVSSAGGHDVNGDGRPDFIVGLNATPLRTAGGAYLVLGPDLGPPPAAAALALEDLLSSIPVAPALGGQDSAPLSMVENLLIEPAQIL